MTVQSRGGVLLSFEKIPLELRLWHAFTAWMHYLGKAFWPTHLAVFYPHPRTAVPVAQGALAGVALVFLTGLFLWVGRRRPFLPVGWLWFVVTLLPVIGIVQSGPQAWADRFTYVPLIGLFIMAAWLLEEVLPFVSGAGVMLVQTVILSGCIALSWTQTASWRDSETLWKHALRVTDENYPAHWNLGAFLNRSGRKDEALFHFQQCLRLMDDVPARMEVARLLLEQGQLEEARTHYLQVLQWEPAYAVARNNLGQIYFLQGKTDLAIEELEKTVQLHPAFAAAHDNLGMVLGARGRWPDAAAHFEQAVRLAPASARFAEHLAEARQRQGGR
jgi:Flp pilus assembly protein TadD